MLPVVAIVVLVVAGSGSSPASPRPGSASRHSPTGRATSPDLRSHSGSTTGGVSGTTTSGAGTSVPAASGAPPPIPDTLARLVGQTIVGRFSGPAPPPSFLARVRAGQVGGVILFSENLAGGPGGARQTVAALQQAARQGGNPSLLVMTDQEGGEVKRLAWAPPTLAPAAMPDARAARAQGVAAGRALRAVGVNVDLAPVADVERVADSFLGTRSFGSSPAHVARLACAFAAGLRSAGVASTLKHFPGLGRALTSTDVQPTTIEASAAELRADYGAYRRCGGGPLRLVMVASAAYPSLTGSLVPAVLAPETYRHELPLAVGGPAPVTISDDLQAPAVLDQPDAAKRALDAGLDLLLYATSPEGSALAYRQLLAAASADPPTRTRLRAANEAVATLKAALGVKAAFGGGGGAAAGG